MGCVFSNGPYNCVGLGLFCTRYFASSEIGQNLAVLTDGRQGFPQLHLANIRIIPQAGHERFFSWFFQFIFQKSSSYSTLHFVLITAFAEITVKSYNNDV
jgi:hypothetical protein